MLLRKKWLLQSLEIRICHRLSKVRIKKYFFVKRIEDFPNERPPASDHLRIFSFFSNFEVSSKLLVFSNYCFVRGHLHKSVAIQWTVQFSYLQYTNEATVKMERNCAIRIYCTNTHRCHLLTKKLKQKIQASSHSERDAS